MMDGSANDGKMIKALIDMTLRNFESLDKLLPEWEKNFTITCAKKGSDIPASRVMYEFMRGILEDEPDVRVVDDILYFFKNGYVKVYVKDEKYNIFFDHWFMIFRRKELLNETTGKADFQDCIFNNVASTYFPRFCICARYISLVLKQYVCMDASASVTFDPLFDAWHYVYSAVVMLMTRQTTRDAGMRLYTLITEKHINIYMDWDPDNEVYPGASTEKN